MDAAHIDLTIFKGCVFREIFELQNDDETSADVSGWTALGQVRKTAGASALVTDIEVSFDVENSLIILEIPAENTAELAPGRYVFDVIVSKVSDEPERFFTGSITVEATITEI